MVRLMGTLQQIKMEFFRKHHIAFHVFTFAVVALFSIVILVPQIFASNPYPAFDEIGHDPLDFISADANNGGVVSASGFATPIGIAMDTIHHWLFVAEADNNRVLVFDLDSNNELIDRTADHVLGKTVFNSAAGLGGLNGFSYPDVIVYDNVHSRLFVSDGLEDRVMVFDFSGGSITNGVNAAYIIGGAGAIGPTTMHSPNGLAYDSTNDRLYVNDTSFSRVLVFDVRPNGSSAQTLCDVTTTGIANAMSASCVLGEPNFTTAADGTVSDASTLIFPIGLFLDEDNSLLYVTSDTISVRVYDVSSISNGEPAIHILGVSDYTTLSYDPNTDTYYDPGVTAYSMLDPRGMMLDTENHILYVSDTGHSRVLGFDVASITDNENAVAVLGQSDFTTAGGGNGQAGIGSPQWSIWEPTSRIQYIVDALSNRVMLFKMMSIDATTLSNATVGIPYTGIIPVNDEQGTVSFEVLSGSIPGGMSFDSTGISGTPTVAGNYSFTIRAIDTVGTSIFYSNHQSYSITVAAAGGGGGGGPIWCQDPLATNFGGSPPCVFQCNDSIDNDADGLVDSADPGCYSNPADPATYVPTDIDETNAIVPPPPPPVIGCMNSTATNYNPLATQDSSPSACTYPQTPVIITPPPTYGSGCTLDAPPGSPLGTIIWTQITGSFCQTVVTVSTAFSSAAEVYRSPYGDVLSKTISAVGLVVGAFVSLSTTLFASPLTFSEVALIPQRLWSLLMIAFGLKKRIRPWGTVYDAVTKQPLDPAYVVLYDKDGKEVATSITDLDGRYGFLVGPGIYRMSAHKTNYSFPSLVLSRHTRDEIYLDLYFGNYFEVKEESKLIARNIPLDPDKFDWNEFMKRQQKLMKFYSKRDRIITRIADVFFAVGFVLALIALLVSPIGYNIAIFVLYVLLLVIKEIGIKPKQLGGVLDKSTLEPISFGLVHIFSKSLNTELMARVLDKKGHYYALVPNATYYITIDRKNPDKTYTKIFTSEPFEVTDGVINRKFLV